MQRTDIEEKVKNFLLDELEVDAGGKALLRAEQDAVPTVPQYIPQSAPLGEELLWSFRLNPEEV